MFKELVIKGGPIHAGKTFVFPTGETAIVGPNGCGKSLLAEYMAFSLFGTVALRGKVSDYKGLSVVAKLSIKGINYVIERDTKTCTIRKDNESLGIGTKACNAIIISLLGYDYNVYKMGNYAGQLDILGLGRLKPSERKTALDRTLGIGIIDKLIKYANDIALKNRHESDALKSVLVDPGQEPVPPTCYREGIRQELFSEYTAISNDIEGYKAFREMERPIQPIKPKEPAIRLLVSDTPVQFLEKVLKRKELETERVALSGLALPPFTKEFLTAQLSQWEKYGKYENYLKSTQPFQDKEPDLTLKEWDSLQTNVTAWRLYDEEMSAYNLQEIKCPNCNHKFNPYRKTPIKPFGERPTVSNEYLQKQRELIAKKQFINQIDVVDPVQKPRMEVSEIYNYISAIDYYNDAQNRLEVIDLELLNLEVYTQEDFNDLQQYEKDFSVYKEKLNQWEVLSAKYNELAQKFDGYNLQWAETRKNELAVYYENTRRYEEKKKEYDQKKAEYDRILGRATEMDQQETRYKTAADNLKTMKVKIKGYVLPSLQKVSSILLSEMSDGLFQKVEIDPDFNILVEDREINLFSGSEQAMINLALRLGLGQVLTHRAFSVFIGDEIDASMRDERAQLTADCLRKISKYIKQVILISHRDIDADHFINLGDK